MKVTRGIASAVILSCALALPALASTPNVVVDQSQHAQTIVAWGAPFGSFNGAAENSIIIDEYVNSLGLTRQRLEPPFGNFGGPGAHKRWEWYNDNGDPNTINWSGLNTAALDAKVQSQLIPFSQKVQANGDPFNFYISPTWYTTGTTGDIPNWMLNSPGEYAEYATSLILYMKNTYGLTADSFCVCNEPDSASTSFGINGLVLGNVVKTLGPKLQALGLPTKIEFAECASTGDSWDFMLYWQNDPTFWPYIGTLSYHLYSNDDATMSDISRLGALRGLPTAQTEYYGILSGSINATMDANQLYRGLTVGGNGIWDWYNQSDFMPTVGNWFVFNQAYWNSRQITHYVRPGATRIAANADNSLIRPLAFVKNGQMTVVVFNNTGGGAGPVSLSGIPAGQYGLSQSLFVPPAPVYPNYTPGTYNELGIQTVGADGKLTINIAASSIVTLYPYAGTNLPPVVTQYEADTNNGGKNLHYLNQPASTATLTAAAVDPEGDPISYQWSVTQSNGASVVLATPNAATTAVSGLTVPGDYIFTVAISDPAHASNPVLRTVLLTVYETTTNHPPSIDQVGSLGPVLITLPSNSCRLQVFAHDLENDPLTFSGLVVSQPPGANASIGTPTATNLNPGWMANYSCTNMTVAGDYTFRVLCSDPAHVNAPTTQDILISVYPVDTAPVIANPTANPSALTLPNNSTTLSATVTLPNANAIAQWVPQGDSVTCWWSVASAPAGAVPVFTNQGAASTLVSGLNLPGTYNFTLSATDRTLTTTASVSVTVSPTPGAPVVTAAAKTAVIGAPFTYTISATNSPTSYNAASLPAGLTLSNNVISGMVSSTSLSGLWNVQLSATNASGTGYANLALTVNLPLPVITSALTVEGYVNQSLSYLIQATNIPLSFTTQNLPPGLTLATNVAFAPPGHGGFEYPVFQTGLISGTPTTPGIYSVPISATNPAGTATATLIIAIYATPPAAPVITNNPLSAAGTVNTPFSFTIQASNNPSGFLAIGLPAGLSFNPNSGLISGTPTSAGTYNVTIEAINLGGIGSATLVLTIASGSGTPPTITTQPTNQAVNAGQTATFTVVASGTAPLSYQWSKNGTVISGATSAAYTTLVTTAADNGAEFSVVVSNSAGSVTSNNATLTVNAVAVAPTVATQPASQTVNAGQTATFTVVASGTAPLTYQWSKNGTAIAGATSAAYTTPATTATDNGSTFSVKVSNAAGSVTSNNATLTVNAVAVAPTITTQPASQTVNAGQTATFTVVASGTAPLSYQWSKNGAAIAGATGAAYTTPATTATDNGATFRVNVTNAAGFYTSTNATLTVNAAPVAPIITTQPASQTVNAGQTATFTVVASGTAPLTYQWTRNGTAISCATSAAYTTPATTAADNGATFSVVVSNAAGSVTSNNSTLTVNPVAVSPTITTQPASQTVNAGQTATFTVVASGTAPLSYQWSKNGTAISGATSAAYTTPAATAADNGATFSVQVSNSAGSVTSNNAALAVLSPPAITSAATASPNPAQAGQSITFTVAANDPDGDPLTYAWTFGDGTNGSGSSVSHVYANAGVYTATVTVTVSDGLANVTSSVSVTVDAAPVAPAITTQLASQTVASGQTATFTVAASGTAPLSYQWQRNGINIAGAISASYTTPATTAADNGAAFDVIVSNAAGNITSNSVTLTVTDSSLVGYWKFDEGSGTLAADSSGNGKNGTLVNGPAWTTGVVGDALSFNGSNTYVTVADAPTLRPAQLTLSAWFNSNNPQTVGAAHQAIITKDGASRAFDLKVVVGQVQFAIGSGFSAGKTQLQANTWYFVTCTYDGSALRIYLNGALDGSITYAAPSGWDNAQPVILGGRNVPSMPFIFNGLLDEIHMYNRALSAAEVQAMYAAYTPGGAGNSSNAGATPATAQLSSVKLSGSATFKALGQDSVSVSGVIPLSSTLSLPGQFDPTGQTLSLYVGGATAQFTLDKTGKAKNAGGAVALKLKRIKGARGTAAAYQSGPIAFNAKLTGHGWSALWGFNPNTTVAKQPLTIDTLVEFESTVYSTTAMATYTSKATVGAKFVTK